MQFIRRIGIQHERRKVRKNGPTLSAGGQEGYADRVGLDGLEACPGSSRSRRPRNAAPNPQCHSRNQNGSSEWLGRFILRVLGAQYYEADILAAPDAKALKNWGLLVEREPVLARAA